MFKSINNNFEKRKTALAKSRNKQGEIKEALGVFLKKEFGDKIKGMSVAVNYNVADNSLILTAGSKTLANELTLRLTSINDYLKKRGMLLARLMVR